jgi:hypothetical protein
MMKPRFSPTLSVPDKGSYAEYRGLSRVTPTYSSPTRMMIQVWGTRGRGFKSRRPDQLSKNNQLNNSTVAR